MDICTICVSCGFWLFQDFLLWVPTETIALDDLYRYTVSEVAQRVKEDFGSIDIVVHSLANGPEVAKPLLETSRAGYAHVT